jgi:hypothetical protein
VVVWKEEKRAKAGCALNDIAANDGGGMRSVIMCEDLEFSFNIPLSHAFPLSIQLHHPNKVA